MERVTLGVVGDPFVGKTLLCVSYTANYVYKDYKPTVLNHHWTNVVVNDHAIDLMIWDNSGSDEYVKLRPLCYPQVDAFLVCFSLKSPESFVSVQTKWIPEIEEHVGNVPVVLVGCKRDDCLKSSLDSLETIDTEEGEEMARAIRARKYVETSAVEQSGFTSVFQTAILAALERKKRLTCPPGKDTLVPNKHCGKPDYYAVHHGNISSITKHAGTLDLFKYKTTVVYTCDIGYELADGTKEQQSFCLQSNKWSALTENCSIVSCPSFVVNNGIVNFTSLEYGGSATVTCNHGFWADNGRTQMTVLCKENKQWSSVASCSVDNLRSKQQQFTVLSGTIRDRAAVADEIQVRSKLECASRCTEDFYCKATNFKSYSGAAGGGTCLLFHAASDTSDLSADPDWNYIEVIP